MDVSIIAMLDMAGLRLHFSNFTYYYANITKAVCIMQNISMVDDKKLETIRL